MKIGDFVETYKGKARMVAVDRVKAMLFGYQNAQFTLPSFTLSRGVYNNNPMKDYTILDITFDQRTIYLDFNGDELLKPTEPPKDIVDYLKKIDDENDDLLAELGKLQDKSDMMLYVNKEVKRQIGNNPTIKLIKEKFLDNIKTPEQVVKKEEVKLANKETRYDKDGAEMTFAFYPKDLIISSINAFADKGVTVLGSIEYFCGIPSQIYHSFGCQITTIIDQINDIPCNVLLSGHLVFLKKGK